MLALRNTPVDLTKWMPISFGRAPPSKVSALTAKGFVIIECTTDFLTRTARRYRKNRTKAAQPTLGACFVLSDDA
jgi:hypothetical protein